MGVSAHWVKLSAGQVHGFLNKQGRASLCARDAQILSRIKVILPQLRFNRARQLNAHRRINSRALIDSVRVPRNEKAPWMASPGVYSYVHTHTEGYRSVWASDVTRCTPLHQRAVSFCECALVHPPPRHADCCRRHYYYMGLYNERLCIYMFKKNVCASKHVRFPGCDRSERIEGWDLCSVFEIFSPPQPLATDNQRVENFHLASSSVDLKASLSLLMATANQAAPAKWRVMNVVQRFFVIWNAVNEINPLLVVAVFFFELTSFKSTINHVKEFSLLKSTHLSVFQDILPLLCSQQLLFLSNDWKSTYNKDNVVKILI